MARIVPRFSVLEMLSLLLVPGLGIAAVRAEGVFVAVALFAAMLWFMGMAVASLVAEGRLRIFAIGFVVVSGIYGGLAIFYGESELGPEGRLPTTQMLERLRQSIAEDVFTEVKTKQAMSLEEARAFIEAAPPNVRPEFDQTTVPDPVSTMLIAHALTGLLLGYLGGKLAVALNRTNSPFGWSTPSQLDPDRHGSAQS